MPIIKNKMRKFVFLTGLLILLASSCATRNGAVTKTEKQLRQGKQTSLSLIAAGDNLIHIEIIKDAKKETGYDFKPCYSEIKPYIKNADIAFINQETLIAGETYGFSGYPLFNGPKEIGEALVDAGFDVVNHATNHAMDKGERAVFEVIDFWEKQPQILMLGLHRDAQSRSETKSVIQKNNIRIGWLAYTYGANGIPLPKDKPYLVSLIDEAVMAKEIDELRLLCDFLIVSMHWGDEYEHTPNKRQRELAVFLAQHKVDLVIGHHPHVIQPVEEFARPDGGKTLVFFSLGNFFSSQKETPTILGALSRVTITKTPDKAPPEQVVITEAEIIPIITHYDIDNIGYKVYPLAGYTPELLDSHKISLSKKTTITEFYTLFSKVFNQNGLPSSSNASKKD